MEIESELARISDNVNSNLETITTEEATKNASVMPFIRMLGFDVFDPSIVVPEFTADVGNKKGEKVDYALKLPDGNMILIECKVAKTELNEKHQGQLHRYFGVTDAKFAILTNGVEYRFFSDLDKPNVMDSKPFYTLNILEYRPRDIKELQKYNRSEFDSEAILSSAERLKYVSQIKANLKQELEGSPSDEFVRLIAGRVYDGRATSNVKDMLAPLITLSYKELVNERLKRQFEHTFSNDAEEEEETITTTQDEIDGYLIVKSIARSEISADRIFMRDAKSYCAILVDDNNRKPLIRLHFNTKNYYITLFDGGKHEERHSIDGLDDIYKYSNQIRETAKHYA